RARGRQNESLKTGVCESARAIGRAHADTAGEQRLDQLDRRTPDVALWIYGQSTPVEIRRRIDERDYEFDAGLAQARFGRGNFGGLGTAEYRQHEFGKPVAQAWPRCGDKFEDADAVLRVAERTHEQ